MINKPKTSKYTLDDYVKDFKRHCEVNPSTKVDLVHITWFRHFMEQYGLEMEEESKRKLLKKIDDATDLGCQCHPEFRTSCCKKVDTVKELIHKQ